MNSNDIEGKNNVDSTIENNDNQDLEVKRHYSARTKGSSSVIDITKYGNVSKGILDITDTPDVAVWNKSVQIKSNVASMVKHPKERENGEIQTIGIGLRNERSKDDDDKKDKKDKKSSTIIDPANQEDIDNVVNSGSTLTDKA
jgi:hypothetical protein